MKTPESKGLAKVWIWLAGLAVAVAVASAAWLWLPKQLLAPWSAAPWLADDADAAVWLGGLDRTGAALAALTQQVEGAKGLLQAADLALGVDLTRPETLTKAGLRPDAGLVALRRAGATWVVLPVSDRRGVQHLLTRLAQRGYAATAATAAQDQERWHIADRQDAKRTVATVWYLPPPRSVALLYWPDTTPVVPPSNPQAADAAKAADPAGPEVAQAALTALLAAKPADPAKLEAIAATAGLARLPESAPIRGWWRIPKADPLRMQVANLIGPASLVFGSVIDRVDRVVVVGELAGPAPRLSLALQAGEPAAKPEDGKLADMVTYWWSFLPEVRGAMLDLADLLPDETPLLVRARLNPGMLSLVPDAIKSQILPSSALVALHPALAAVDVWSQLIAVWDGQLAGGVLAVADSVPLDPAAWPSLWWRTALRPWVAVALKTDRDAQLLLERVTAALDAAKTMGTLTETVAPAQFRDWTGIAVSGPDAPWWLLRKDRRVAFVSGQGTEDDLRRVASGRLPDLAAAIKALPATALLPGLIRGEGQWLGVAVQTPRVVRALRRRGVPDYATQLLASVASLSAQVRLTPDALWIDAELRPARRRGTSSGAAAGNLSAGAK
jgi:hypothetical protein